MKTLPILLLLVVLLNACASLAPRDNEYNWVRSETRPPLPMTLEVVEEWPEIVKKHCGWGSLLHACAIYYWDENKVYTHCVVYTRNKNLPQFLRNHEKKHCDGWDHKEK